MPSWETHAAVTAHGWLIVCWQSRTRASHTRQVPSSEAEAHVFASREGLNELTTCVWPLNWRTRPPVFASHSAAVLSADAEKALSPSPDHDTSRIAFACPLKLRMFAHSPKVSQSSISLSWPPDST